MFPQGPFTRPARGGHLTGKDYTKYIRWTPKRIIISALCLAVPYLAIVVALALYVNQTAAILLLVLLGFVGAIIGILYGLAKLSV